MSNYYVKSKTRGRNSGIKGTPQQAVNYLTDDHDSKRIASASKAEIDYITRINSGYKTDLEGGRLPLEGHGRCSGLDESKMKDVFLKSCIPRHRDVRGRKTSATEGYKSHTLTLPKELSLLAESNPKTAYKAMNKAISEALENAYPGKDFAAVSSIHRRNNEAEIHYHAHVLVAKFVKDKKTGKTHSLNNAKLMDGNARESNKLKAAWTEAVTRELAKELQVKIQQERNQRIILTLPDGRTLEPLNRASRREIEKAIAPQITYIDKHGKERIKSFSLTSMDAKILEIGSREKGRNGWNRNDFLKSFPKDSIRIERFEKRVETLKSVGYLSPSGRVTKDFFDHAKLKWGDRPELHQIRSELERNFQKTTGQSIPDLLKKDTGLQERIRLLGLTEKDLLLNRGFRHYRSEITPEDKELHQAELELKDFDKSSKERINKTPLLLREIEMDKLNAERRELLNRLETLKFKSDLSQLSPSERSTYFGTKILQGLVDADVRNLEKVRAGIKDLEERKASELAGANNPKSVKRIEKWYAEKLNPLRATERNLTDQLNEHRHWLDKYQRREQLERVKPKPIEKTEQEMKRQSPKKTVSAYRALLTNKGIGFLIKTALGPGLPSAMLASYAASRIREREQLKNIPEWKTDNLRKGIQTLGQSFEPEAKLLSQYKGKEEELALRMQNGSLNPKTQEAALRAEKLGDILNRADRYAREGSVDIPKRLEELRSEITLINARSQAMGLQPLSRQTLDTFTRNGLQSAFNDDPALTKLSQAGSQWVELPVKVVQVSLGRLTGINFVLSLGR